MTAERLMAMSALWFCVGFLAGEAGLRIKEKVKSRAPVRGRELDNRRPW